MKIIELFPTLLLGKVLNNITPEQIDSYKEYCLKLPYVDLGQNGQHSKDQSLLDNPIFNPLKSTILENASFYLKKLNHVVQGLQICNSWSNILNKGTQINLHKHSNSYISGAFYLDSSSPITFHNPNNFINYGWDPYIDSREPNQTSINPIKGLLLIFPSWLSHSVSPSLKDNRISIAFNIIPKGEFGNFTSKIHF